MFEEKLSAFLHDPVDKPFILKQTGQRHEERAKKLAEKIFVQIASEDKAFDHIASAMERAFLPKGKQIKFLESPCIIHPLSGKKWQGVKAIKEISLNEIMQTVDTVFDVLGKKRFQDDVQKFFYLWRNLLPLLEQKSPHQMLRKLWAVAPADTRIPDHSIFEHLKIGSACVRSARDADKIYNCCSLFLFSVGPVQSFIAQARKAQDLYWGSFILSYLCWEGIKVVAGEFGPDCIIFPDIHGQPLADDWLEKKLGLEVIESKSRYLKIPSIPNRFMAILPENKSEKLRDIGKKVSVTVRQAFQTMAEETVEDKWFISDEHRKAFYNQIKDFLQIYWTSLPWGSAQNGKADWEVTLETLLPFFSANELTKYKKLLLFATTQAKYQPNVGNLYGLLHSMAEKSLAGRKNSRLFAQLQETGRKCSLCGERNLLFYRKSVGEMSQKDNSLYDKKLFHDHCKIFSDNKALSLKFLTYGEGLCAICFVKRRAEDLDFFKKAFGKDKFERGFPPVAEIAQAGFLEAIEATETGKALIEEFKNIFSDDEFDAQLLYKENLTDQYFAKYAISSNKLELALGKHGKIEKLRKERGIAQSKYYAVLAFDGDDMGKWLSGDKAPLFSDIYHPIVWDDLSDTFKDQLSGGRLMSPARHAALSNAMKQFALEFVPRIVEQEHSAKLVYAGGDDLLAFVPLQDLFNVMIKLRGAFSGHIDSQLKVDFNQEASGFVEMGDRLVMTMGASATASAGVCVAHYKTPLAMVIQRAKQMLKKAKDEGRNRYSLAVIKHSGEQVETTMEWIQEGAAEGSLSLMKELVAEFQKAKKSAREGITDKFVYTLREEFDRLVSDQKRSPYVAIMKEELMRLMERGCQIRDRGEKRKLVDRLRRRLYDLYTSSTYNKFIGFLEIAVFLARQT